MQPIQHVADDSRERRPVGIGHRRVHLRPRPDIEDRLAARRRAAEDVADSSECVDGAPADLERASQRHVHLGGAQRRTLLLEALWTERLDRGAQFRAAVCKVLRAPAGGKDDGSEVRRAQLVHHAVSDLTNEPRLPFIVPSQRVVEQDHDQALRGDVVGRHVRVHVASPLGTRRSGD